MLPTTQQHSYPSQPSPLLSAENTFSLEQGIITTTDGDPLQCPCGEGISKWDYVQAKCEVNYWKTQHARAVEREKQTKANLEVEIEKLNAKIKLT